MSFFLQANSVPSSPRYFNPNTNGFHSAQNGHHIGNGDGGGHGAPFRIPSPLTTPTGPFQQNGFHAVKQAAFQPLRPAESTRLEFFPPPFYAESPTTNLTRPPVNTSDCMLPQRPTTHQFSHPKGVVRGEKDLAVHCFSENVSFPPPPPSMLCDST